MTLFLRLDPHHLPGRRLTLAILAMILTPTWVVGQSGQQVIDLSLEEAHHGTTRAITLQTTAVCPTCNGSGMRENQPCSTCRGAGVVTRPKTLDVTIPAGRIRRADALVLADQAAAPQPKTEKEG